MIRWSLLLAGILLLAVVGIRSQASPIDHTYWIYYVEVDYSNNHSTLYRVSRAGTHRQKLLEENSVFAIRNVSFDGRWLLLEHNNFDTRLSSVERFWVNGRKRQMLISPQSDYSCLRLSDDEKWLFYEERVDVRPSLRRVRLDGSDDSLVMEGLEFYQCLTWATQGKSLVVTTENREIYHIEIGSWEKSVLMSQTRGFLELSPDSKWMTVAYEGKIILVDMVGETHLTLPESERSSAYVIFSADSKTLAFLFYDEVTRNNGLKIVDFATLRLQTISPEVIGDVNLITSIPSSKQFIVVTNMTSETDIYRLNDNGTGLMPLVTEMGADWLDNVSLDGQWFITDSQPDGQIDLYLFRTDGTAQRRLTHSVDNEITPHFAPMVSLLWHAEILAIGAVLCLVGAGWSIGRRLR